MKSRQQLLYPIRTPSAKTLKLRTGLTTRTRKSITKEEASKGSLQSSELVKSTRNNSSSHFRLSRHKNKVKSMNYINENEQKPIEVEELTNGQDLEERLERNEQEIERYKASLEKFGMLFEQLSYSVENKQELFKAKILAKIIKKEFARLRTADEISPSITITEIKPSVEAETVDVENLNTELESLKFRTSNLLNKINKK